jgi:hypothetical protein
MICDKAINRTETSCPQRADSPLVCLSPPPAIRALWRRARHRCWLAAQALPEATRESVEQLLRVHDLLGQELAKAEGYLRAVDHQFLELVRLRTLPGIGEILAPACTRVVRF